MKYDVCIIGSGASGGIAALVLTRAGFNVAVLEAGPPLNVDEEYRQHLWPYEVPDRGMNVCGDGRTLMANGFWRIPGEPYLNSRGTDFRWFRSRLVGGRTNHWGRGVARFTDVDLKARSLTGEGEDWPISYSDIEPYYDLIEQYVGVSGPTRYDCPTSSMMPAPSPKCYERLIAKACGDLALRCIPTASAVLGRPHNGRPSCHYCAQCPRGCKQGSGFSIGQTAVPDSLKTGRLTLITNAMARELITDSQGRLTGVSYIDKRTCLGHTVSADCFVLAASACESARLLLNSRSRSHPNGLANQSGVVGRYLKDAVGVRVQAYIPSLAAIPPHNCDGFGRPHIFVPWWFPEGAAFSKGYEILFSGGRELPSMGLFDFVADECEGFGAALKKRCRSVYGTDMSFIATGAMQTNQESFCETDPNTLDTWGVPVLRFTFKWGAQERAMAEHMHLTIRNLIEALGGKYLGFGPVSSEMHGLTRPGENFRETGTARMGNDADGSVVNQFCQSHQVKNLFVIDGGCFVTLPEKPPTLTMMALAWRAADYICTRRRDL